MIGKSIQTTRQLGKYAIQRRLGGGAYSTIFEVEDPGTERRYALKRIVRRTFSDDRFFRQAENEFAVGRQIDHPAVRKMVQVFRFRSLFRLREMHLLMELCLGETLETHRPRDMLAVTRIFAQCVEGLDAMHEAGFAHADVKPNNIIVAPDGVVKLIDFGQSCPLGTVKQRIQGTPDYIAPEQVHRQPIDWRTDVFNVGATLYWILTGRYVPTALPRSRPGGELSTPTPAPVTPPDQINPRIPTALSRLVLDCVHVVPTDRPANMKALAGRLKAIEVILMKTQAQAAVCHVPGQEDAAAGRDGEADTVDLPGVRVDEAV